MIVPLATVLVVHDRLRGESLDPCRTDGLVSNTSRLAAPAAAFFRGCLPYWPVSVRQSGRLQSSSSIATFASSSRSCSSSVFTCPRRLSRARSCLEQWRLLYNLNPMVGIIDGFRWCIVGGGKPHLSAGLRAQPRGYGRFSLAWHHHLPPHRARLCGPDLKMPRPVTASRISARSS